MKRKQLPSCEQYAALSANNQIRPLHYLVELELYTYQFSSRIIAKEQLGVSILYKIVPLKLYDQCNTSLKKPTGKNYQTSLQSNDLLNITYITDMMSQ